MNEFLSIPILEKFLMGREDKPMLTPILKKNSKRQGNCRRVVLLY
jgi:hypothetical protein